MGKLTASLERALKRHGIARLAPLVLERALRFASRVLPSVRNALADRERRAVAFDRHFGVDTAGIVRQVDLRTDSPNQIHAVSYGASDPERFRKALISLGIDYGRFVFVDLGSGKGRAVLMAAQFPFRKVVGVELSEELTAIAEGNLAAFRRAGHACTEVELVCTDASVVELPSGDLVCYLCNPFDQVVMAEVLSNIKESVTAQPREVIVVYYNPKQARLLDEDDTFEAIGDLDGVRVWRVRKSSQ